jgi:hypothetical protein
MLGFESLLLLCDVLRGSWVGEPGKKWSASNQFDNHAFVASQEKVG